MGAKPSVPSKKQKPDVYGLRENFIVVPFEDLVVGRKYHVLQRDSLFKVTNYRDEPLTFTGARFDKGDVFLSFTFRSAYFDRNRPIIQKQTYNKDAVTVYQSRDTLAAEQAFRGLASRVPEDVVHEIEYFVTGVKPRENRYPARGLKDYTVENDYFAGTGLTVKRSEAEEQLNQADELYRKLYTKGADWFTIREEVGRISESYAERVVDKDIDDAGRLFIRQNPFNEDGTERTLDYYYALCAKGDFFAANTSGITPSYR